MRVSDAASRCRTGPEIGVASTKAFTAPLVICICWLCCWRPRGVLKDDAASPWYLTCAWCPTWPAGAQHRAEIKKVAHALRNVRDCLTGRGINMPIAFEGALKLKEISYIMPKATRWRNETRPDRPDRKHMPVVCIAPKDPGMKDDQPDPAGQARGARSLRGY